MIIVTAKAARVTHIRISLFTPVSHYATASELIIKKNVFVG